MLYSKPKNMKYTDLCIYVDSVLDKYNSGSYKLTEIEEEKCFKYICIICGMLASKRKLRLSVSEMDDFILWCGGEIYTRCFNPQTAKALSNPINHILPYIKNVLTFRKLKYSAVFGQNNISTYQKIDNHQFIQAHQRIVYNKFELIEDVKDFINQYMQDLYRYILQKLSRYYSHVEVVHIGKLIIKLCVDDLLSYLGLHPVSVPSNVNAKYFQTANIIHNIVMQDLGNELNNVLTENGLLQTISDEAEYKSMYLVENNLGIYD